MVHLNHIIFLHQSSLQYVTYSLHLLLHCSSDSENPPLLQSPKFCLLCCPGTRRGRGRGAGRNPENPGRLTGCDRTQRYQLSRRHPGGGGGVVIWGLTLLVSRPPPGHCRRRLASQFFGSARVRSPQSDSRQPSSPHAAPLKRCPLTPPPSPSLN